MSVPAPVITGCTISTSLGVFQSATITWTMPSGYLKANAVVGAGTSIVAVAPITPAPTIGGTNPGPYTYVYTSALLDTIVASLFGSTSYVGVRTADGAWTSPWATRKLTIGLLGLNSTCSLS